MKLLGAMPELLGRLLAALLMTLPLAADAFGSSREASRRVAEGLRFYQARDYKAAAQAFAEADVALPENATIAFNRACVHAAQGESEKASGYFQTAAASRDQKLAADSHYNLGCVAVAQARSLFGKAPEEAAPEARDQGMRLLGEAVGHYRDCLQMDAGHEAARRNLEILRLWIKHMREVWADRDRQKRREEMDLLEFLDMIQTEQQRLRGMAKALSRAAGFPQAKARGRRNRVRSTGPGRRDRAAQEKARGSSSAAIARGGRRCVRPAGAEAEAVPRAGCGRGCRGPVEVCRSSEVVDAPGGQGPGRPTARGGDRRSNRLPRRPERHLSRRGAV